MLRKIFIISLVFFGVALYAESGLQENLNGAVQEMVPNVESDRKVDYVNIGKEVQNWIFMLIGIIAVAYLVYVGAKMLWAPGSIEEMHSSVHSLIYIIIGLALIPFAYVLIQLIVNIRL